MTCESRHLHATVHAQMSEDNFVELPVIFQMNSCCQADKAHTLAAHLPFWPEAGNFMVDGSTTTGVLN